MIKITENKGFQMTFNNGLTISCQIGSNNYCDNRSYNFNYQPEMRQSITECSNCEVAIWNNNDEWITGKIFKEIGMKSTEDMVAGWVDVDTVAKLISYISTK